MPAMGGGGKPTCVKIELEASNLNYARRMPRNRIKLFIPLIANQYFPVTDSVYGSGPDSALSITFPNYKPPL